MMHFSGDYYVYEGELYRKVKQTTQGYHIKNKLGKLVWITMDAIQKVIATRPNTK